MLKGIPKILSPELLKVLCEMGHADRIVISDGNFPAMSVGKDSIVVRLDGHGVPEVLDAILQIFPLDTYVEHPVNLMEVMKGDPVETPIWDTYSDILKKHRLHLCKRVFLGGEHEDEWKTENHCRFVLVFCLQGMPHKNRLRTSDMVRTERSYKT
ncbi:MAG: hypothetical protein IKX96_03620 [Firmicutes bacterium]|nr:hypothetical protein [Bacillota bacterium]